MPPMVGRSQRVLSGMRPSGRLHLGHLHGSLKTWIELQNTFACFFFVADLHALATDYERPGKIGANSLDMVVDWLAAGVLPDSATLFVQSKVPEHAELAVLLGMIAPLGWLERVPSFKEQQERLRDRDVSTYGFLGYPVLQSADILLYRAALVAVGDDQLANVELTREMARRFNHLYGSEPDFAARAEAAVPKLGARNAQLYRELRRSYQEQGDLEALDKARALLKDQQSMTHGDLDRLFGYLEGSSRVILQEPQALRAESRRIPGLDGHTMSNAAGNAITLRDTAAEVEAKIRTMPTDPARVRRADPGDPRRCPVWALHQVYSDAETRDWVQQGCTSAGIGCLECKQPIIEAVDAEIGPIRVRAEELAKDPTQVRVVLNEGTDAARDVARDTMEHVRRVMGLSYR